MSRLTLSPLALGDGPELADANASNREYHAPWTTLFTDADGFAAYIERGEEQGSVTLLVRETSTRVPVALIRFSQISMGNFCSAYLGYNGYEETGGRGLVTEALVEACEYGFSNIGLNRIEANIQPGNSRSIALVRRAGFSKEGFSPRYLKIDGQRDSQWQDHERWAILAPQKN